MAQTLPPLLVAAVIIALPLLTFRHGELDRKPRITLTRQ
jgi:hypothetical protein